MTNTVGSLTRAAPNMTPEYEVKLLLNPTAVLGTDGGLTNDILSTFNMPSTVTKQNIQFLDNSSKELYTAGWSVRIRKTENEDDFELTYKKRYTIMDGNIKAALTKANEDHFNTGDSKYEAQVEWGYQKQTLSISRKKTATDSENSGLDLPGTSKSRAMAIAEAPDKFDDWLSRKWGTGVLATSRIFGPVLAKRWIGRWNGMRLYIEVWPILNCARTGMEYIVEASFKTDSHAVASTEHGSFITFLQDKGWFLAQDSLKTQLIMERY
jgi:hypothetical protein